MFPLLMACSDEVNLEEITGCVSCIEAGGTWQEEANLCTASCDVQDISCARVLELCPE